MSSAPPLFANNWNVYQKIVFMNYMLHKEIGEATTSAIQSFLKKDSISVLDLGCGDAHQIAVVLKEFPIVSYTGFDLAAPALEVAAQNLSGIKARILLKQGRMEELLLEETQSFDLIYTSFAIHHLSDPEKKSLLQQCYDSLHPGGLFIHIDVSRKPSQTREEYIASYINHMKADWSVLSAEEISLIVEHITQCDYPAESTDLMEWVQQIGFSVRSLFEGDGKHGMLALQK